MIKVLSSTLGKPDSNGAWAEVSLVCDEVSDLPNQSIGGVRLSMNSTAYIIETGKTYKIKSNGTWVEQPSGGGGGGSGDAYTKAETDALLENKQPYDIPDSITSPDDLDYYYTVGTFSVPASGIDNSPVSVVSRLDIIELPSDRVQQKLTALNSTNDIYVRQSTSSPSGNVTALIPAMTSTTTPSGTVISSGSFGTRYSWQAFDGVDSETWQSNSWGDSTNSIDGLPESCYVGYEFTSSVQVNSYEISFSSDTTYVGIIQTRNNNTWTTQATVSIAPNGYSKVTGTFDTVTCDAVRFSILSGNQPYFTTNNYGGNVCEFQVYFADDKPTWTPWYQITMQQVQVQRSLNNQRTIIKPDQGVERK